MDENEITDIDEDTTDAEVLAKAVDNLRESMRAAVAGLMFDGFTKREAHALIAGVFSQNIEKIDEEDS